MAPWLTRPDWDEGRGRPLSVSWWWVSQTTGPGTVREQVSEPRRHRCTGDPGRRTSTPQASPSSRTRSSTGSTPARGARRRSHQPDVLGRSHRVSGYRPTFADRGSDAGAPRGCRARRSRAPQRLRAVAHVTDDRVEEPPASAAAHRSPGGEAAAREPRGAAGRRDTQQAWPSGRFAPIRQPGSSPTRRCTASGRRRWWDRCRAVDAP